MLGRFPGRPFLRQAEISRSQFRAFWAVTKRYAELTRSDLLIHRSVAGAVNGLLDFLEVERKRVPGDVLRDAERLQCLLFSGYDRISKGMNHRACKSGLFPESVLSALYGFFVAAVKDTLGCRLPQC